MRRKCGGRKKRIGNFHFPSLRATTVGFDDSHVAAGPIHHPPTRAGGEGSNSKKGKWGGILLLAHQVSQNCLSDVVCSYPSAHHTAAATAEGG